MSTSPPTRKGFSRNGNNIPFPGWGNLDTINWPADEWDESDVVYSISTLQLCLFQEMS